MNVAELKALLDQHDDDREVCLYDHDSCDYFKIKGVTLVYEPLLDKSDSSTSATVEALCLLGYEK